jgi:two-component system OmpR family response regulator
VLRTIDDGDALATEELRAGALRMDVARHQVYANGRIIRVTPIEFDLLRYLLAHAGRVISRQELLEHVWRYQDGDDRDLVKSHIASLRHRLRDAGVSDAHIENVYGVGYMLSSAGSPVALLGIAPTQGQAGDWW